MRHMQRILALALMCSLLLCSLPTAVFAADALQSSASQEQKAQAPEEKKEPAESQEKEKPAVLRNEKVQTPEKTPVEVYGSPVVLSWEASGDSMRIVERGTMNEIDGVLVSNGFAYGAVSTSSTAAPPYDQFYRDPDKLLVTVPGTYYIWIMGRPFDTEQYCDSEPKVMGTATITRRTVSADLFSFDIESSYPYTGEAIIPNITYNHFPNFEIRPDWNRDFVLEQTDNVLPGKVMLRILPAENGCFDFEPVTLEYEIVPAMISLGWKQHTISLAYTGLPLPMESLLTAETKGGQPLSLTYHLDWGQETFDAATRPIPVGQHILSVCADAPYHQHHDWETVSLHVAKGMPVLKAPVAASGLSYTGEPLPLLASAAELQQEGFAYDADTRIYYAVTDQKVSGAPDAAAFSEELPAAVLPGNYRIWYCTRETDNFRATDPASLDVTVARAEIPQNHPRAQGKTDLIYNENAQALVTEDPCKIGDLLYSLEENGIYSPEIPVGTDAGTYTIWFRYHMDDFHADTAPEKLTVSIAPMDISQEMSLDGWQHVTYDPVNIKPEIRVSNGKTVLTEGKDYLASCDGTADAGTKIMIHLRPVSGGNYVFTPQNLPATVLPLSVTPTIEVGQAIYTGHPVKPSVKVTYKGYTFAEGKDYTLNYSENLHASDTRPYHPTVQITFLKECNYGVRENFPSSRRDNGRMMIAFPIARKPITPVVIVEKAVYSGEKLEPAVTVRDGDRILPPEAYTVVYENNLHSGKGKVTVTEAQKGNYSFAPVSQEFSIDPMEVTPSLQVAEGTYSGKPVEPPVKLTAGDRVLQKDTDYTLVYENNLNAGTGKVTAAPVSGSNYSFSPVTGEFPIAPRKIKITARLGETCFLANGRERTPAVTVTAEGGEMLAPSAYTVTWENNVEPGNASAIITPLKGGNLTFPETKLDFRILKSAEEAAKPVTKDPNATLENVKTSEKAALEQQNQILEELLKNPDLTAQEKKTLSDRKDRNDALLERIEKAEQAENQVLDSLSRATPQTVKPGDAKHLQKDVKNLQNLLGGPYAGNLTEREKVRVRKALENARASLVTEQILYTTLDPRNAGVKPDNVAMRDQYTAIRNAYNGLTQAERKQMPGVAHAKMLALAAKLEYRVIEGGYQRFVPAKTKDLKVVANGSYKERFAGLLVDNVLLTEGKEYTAGEGSTVVILKASYLKTLALGNHSVRFHYYEENVEDAYADTVVTAVKKVTPSTDNPKTGDPFRPGIWIGLLVVSAGALAAGDWFYFRKKHKK